VWPAPSRETTVSCTAIPAGAEIVGGDSAPPGSMVNVAGIRASLGGGGDLLAEPWAAVVRRFGTVVAARVSVIVEAPVVVVVVVVAAAVAPAVVVAAVAPVLMVPLAVVPAPAAVVLELLAEPHPARRRTDISPTALSEWLTAPA
jgi:hypothetical protein